MRLTFSITLTSVRPWAISARPFLDVLSVQGRHGACKCWCVFSSEGTRVRGSSKRARETGINGMHHPDLALFRRLLQQARPYCVHVIAIFLLGLLATPLGLLTPLPLKIIVANVIGTHPPPWFLSRTLPASATRSSTGVLTTAVVLLLGVAALENLFALANSFLRTWTAEKLLLDFRVRLFSHLQRLSLGYHDAKGTTDSVYRIQYDTASMQYLAIDGLGPFVTSAVTLLVMFYVTFRIDAQLAMVAMVIAPVLWIGVAHVRARTLTLGSLLLVVSYLGQLYAPLKTIGRKATSLQSHWVGLERAFSVLDQLPDVPERPGAVALVRASGCIVFQHVTFSYEENHLVLQDICFEVPRGARVGIAGRTGAGKTTLLTLLTRFYDPTSGQILLDCVDLRDYRLADLRSQFAIVLQEPVLFSTSITENIAYARPGATEEEIVQAAKMADAHDFILALPNGYQTLVGERGIRLSGGERQRISLARAFLKDAPILLLDEPTSSVDMKTEAAILKATERLMRGRTTFTIAHRLSTLESCDVMLGLEHGRLVQLGVLN